MPELLSLGCGAVRSTRYRLVSGDDSFGYLVIHEFASLAMLQAYRDSPTIASRWQAYAQRWGRPAVARTRVFEPIFQRDGGAV